MQLGRIRIAIWMQPLFHRILINQFTVRESDIAILIVDSGFWRAGWAAFFLSSGWMK